MAKKKKKEKIKATNLDVALGSALGTPYGCEPKTHDIKDELSRPEHSQDGRGHDVVIEIQHHLINKDFDAASQLIANFRGASGTPFSYDHMQRIVEWVRSIYKHTDVQDMSKNYYDHRVKKEITGAKELKSAEVSAEHIEKFIKDIEKVVTKKLEVR